MDETNVLDVFLYDEKIGSLTLLPGDQTLFSFSQTYIHNSHRATLSLSFKSTLGELITEIKPTRAQIPPFFSNLLPEGHLREYLAKQLDINSKREFFLLQALGGDLPGAVTVKKNALIGKKKIASKPIATTRKNKNILRFSLAGVQLKFSALASKNGGLTIPTEGMGGAWILKLPSTRFENVPENEFSMMTLARLIGIDIPKINLVAFEKIQGLPSNMGLVKGNCLAIRRFDRSPVGPIHIEDFAQVFGVYPNYKYERASYKNIAEVISIEVGEKGTSEFIRRLVFNTLIGNADMHLKNWSLIYPNRQKAELSPAYDLVSTIPYIADKEMALNFVKSKQMADLSRDLLSYFASKAKISNKLVQDTATQTVQQFKEIWRAEKKNLPLKFEIVKNIDQHLAQIKLYQEI